MSTKQKVLHSFQTDMFLLFCRNLNECENENYGSNNNKLFLNSHKICSGPAC